jgi:CBS-domain-containing membrane protein
MTIDIKFCYDDEVVEHVSRHMGDEQVRRLPVVNRHNRLVGILALGDLANQGTAQQASQALEGISRPLARHTSCPS